MNVKAVLLKLHQRPIAYYPIYRQITGSTPAAVLISQLMYWWEKMDGQEFYKTDQDIMEETSLTPKELRTAKSKIKKLDWVSMNLRGVPATTYYDFDAELLLNAISESGQTRLSQRAKLDGPKGTNKNGRKGQTLHKNTHKTTSTLSISEEIEKNLNWEVDGDERFKAACAAITAHMAEYPGKWEEIANGARVKLNKTQFKEELIAWLRHHQDNYDITSNSVLRLTGGKSSFQHSWLRQPWCIKKYNEPDPHQKTDQIPQANNEGVYDGDASITRRKPKMKKV